MSIQQVNAISNRLVDRGHAVGAETGTARRRLPASLVSGYTSTRSNAVRIAVEGLVASHRNISVTTRRGGGVRAMATEIAR